MSIRHAHLRYKSNTPASLWIPKNELNLGIDPDDYALSFIRHIFRDRNDIDQMPVIEGISFTDRENEWGHDAFIEVTYSKKGYRATYAAKRDHFISLSNVTCYMD